MNMKFISFSLAFCLLFVCSCSSKKAVDVAKMYPPYKLINLFSQKIKPEINLNLRSYGINNYLPKNYEYINGIGSFAASYSLSKAKNDEVSLNYARSLMVFLSDLDVHPFLNSLLTLSIYFEDENRIQLGQGVAVVHLHNGKIEYEGYQIFEYRSQYPTVGKHYLIHEESYADALEIVKKQGALKML